MSDILCCICKIAFKSGVDAAKEKMAPKPPPFVQYEFLINIKLSSGLLSDHQKVQSTKVQPSTKVPELNTAEDIKGNLVVSLGNVSSAEHEDAIKENHINCVKQKVFEATNIPVQDMYLSQMSFRESTLKAHRIKSIPLPSEPVRKNMTQELREILSKKKKREAQMTDTITFCSKSEWKCKVIPLFILCPIIFVLGMLEILFALFALLECDIPGVYEGMKSGCQHMIQIKYVCLPIEYDPASYNMQKWSTDSFSEFNPEDHYIDHLGKIVRKQELDNGELSSEFKTMFLVGFCVFILTAVVIILFIYNLLCTGNCTRVW